LVWDSSRIVNECVSGDVIDASTVEVACCHHSQRGVMLCILWYLLYVQERERTGVSHHS
jgi:hypothetical protein